jgi:hypothetical protein
MNSAACISSFGVSDAIYWCYKLGNVMVIHPPFYRWIPDGVRHVEFRDRTAMQKEDSIGFAMQVENVLSVVASENMQEFGVGAIPCSQCKEIYKSEDLLNIHMKLHACPNKFQCTVCEKVYPRKKMLTHLRTSICM